MNWSIAIARKGVFVVAALVLPGLVGCGADGSMDPNVAGALSSVTGGAIGSNSKEAKMLSAGAKGLQSITLSDRDAAEIGESIAVAVTHDYGVVKDDKLNAYVAKVGLTIVAVCERPEQNFTFGVLDTDEVNALSMPGGYVFVTRGALARMKDESELAGVLAHEIGHVCKAHGKEAIKRAKGMDALATAGSAQTSGIVAEVIESGSKEILKPMGAGEETEADVKAVAYLRAAGYDPNGYLRYLERSQVSGSGGMLATHPSTAARVTKVKSAIGATSGGATLATRFSSNTASVPKR
mgnify:CR=1 FL=1